MMNASRSVRKTVAQFTDEIHTRLHSHAAIGRLISSDISVDEYQTLLRSYHQIYSAAESRRSTLNIWPEHALRGACNALAFDITGHQHTLDETVFEWVETPQAALGMLYVLHGANFGGKVIARKLQTTLPHVSKTFFMQAGVAESWRSLVGHLEVSGAEAENQQEISHAAQHTFEIFDRMAASKS